VQAIALNASRKACEKSPKKVYDEVVKLAKKEGLKIDPKTGRHLKSGVKKGMKKGIKESYNNSLFNLVPCQTKDRKTWIQMLQPKKDPKSKNY
jgi:hypothetical protein